MCCSGIHPKFSFEFPSREHSHPPPPHLSPILLPHGPIFFFYSVCLERSAPFKRIKNKLTNLFVSFVFPCIHSFETFHCIKVEFLYKVHYEIFSIFAQYSFKKKKVYIDFFDKNVYTTIESENEWLRPDIIGLLRAWRNGRENNLAQWVPKKKNSKYVGGSTGVIPIIVSAAIMQDGVLITRKPSAQRRFGNSVLQKP